MLYRSTRGGEERLSFEETVLTGLAPNGGLFIPTNIPSLPPNFISEWKSLSFNDLAFNILSLFIPSSEIPPNELKGLIERSYATFRTPEVAPLRQVGDNEYVMELWHGPTWAFKDVALQFLGNLFEWFLKRRNDGKEPGEKRERLTVLGATSGDTGSAAIYGLRSKTDISIFILHPYNRVSPIQEAQMTTVLDENVFNLAVDGTFDDCQDIVKSLFSDVSFNSSHKLGAINSINWARILAQITYYFSSYLTILRTCPQFSTGNPPKIQYVVPTGNFGDILAGYYAKRLGLPIGKLVVATNENDILTRFFHTGIYSKPTSLPQDKLVTDGAQSKTDESGVKETLSPAMDILVSSNFERLLWYLVEEGEGEGKGGDRVKEWMGKLKEEGRFEVSKAILELARRDFEAERVSDEETKETIRYFFAPPETSDQYKYGSYVIDPHTAVGLTAVERMKKVNPPSTTVISLSTAHPAKFSSAVASSLSSFASFDFDSSVLPEEFKGLLEKEKRVLRVRAIKSEQMGLGGKQKWEELREGTKAVVEEGTGRLWGGKEGKGKEAAV